MTMDGGTHGANTEALWAQMDPSQFTADERAARTQRALYDAGLSRDCQWFHACDNRAEGFVSHPILGDVPCCAMCAYKLGLEWADV